MLKIIKRLWPVLISIILIVNIITPALAQSNEKVEYKYQEEARHLHNMGFYRGTSKTGFEPSLGRKLSREQLIVMMVRIFGNEKEALSLKEKGTENILSSFPDKDKISKWAIKYVSYAANNRLISVDRNTALNPKEYVKGNEYFFWILQALGYKLDMGDYPYAAARLVEAGGLSPTLMLKMNDRILLRDDFAGITFSVMNAKYPNGEKLISNLIENKNIPEEKALAAGLYLEEKARKEADKLVAKLKMAAEGQLSHNADITAAEQLLEKTRKAAEKTGSKDYDAIISEYGNVIKKARDVYTARIKAENEIKNAITDMNEALGKDLTVEDNIKAAEEKREIAKNLLPKVMKYGKYSDINKKIENAKDTLDNKRKDYEAIQAVEKYEKAPAETLKEIQKTKILWENANEAVNVAAGENLKSDLRQRIKLHKEMLDQKELSLTPVEIARAYVPGLRTIVVKFSKKISPESVDEDTVEVSEDYDDLFLSEDKKSMEVLLKNPLDQSDEITLQIDGISDLDGFFISDYSIVLMAEDMTPPYTHSFSFINQNKVRVDFNEPVNFGTSGIFKTFKKGGKGGIDIDVDGKYLNIRVIPDENMKEYVLEFLNPLKDGKHTLNISGIKDPAGYKIRPVSFDFTSVTDIVPPEPVELAAENTETLLITFDEKVFADKNCFKIKEISGNEILPSKVEVDDNKVTITLQSALSAASIISYEVEINDVTDEMGNALNTVLEGQVDDEDQPPVINSFNVTDDNTLKLCFDESVDVSNIDFTLYDSSANVIEDEEADISIAGESENHKEYELSIEYVKNRNASSYGLEVSGAVDKSVRKNKMDKQLISFVSNDEYNPEIKRAVRLDDDQGDNDRIEITFSEGMDVSTIEATSTYFIKRAGDTALVSVASKDGEVLKIEDDGKKITLIVPGVDVQNFTHIAVLGAMDIYGKGLSGEGSSLTGYKEMNIGYSLVNHENVIVKAVDTNKIRVGIDQDKLEDYLFTSVNMSAFKLLYSTGDEVFEFENDIVDAELVSGGREIELTVVHDFNADATENKTGNGNSILLYIPEAGVTDINENPVKILKKNAVLVSDAVSPALEGLQAEDNTITLTFDEPLEYADKIKVVHPVYGDMSVSALTTAVEVKQGDNILLPIVQYIAELDDNGAVVITVTDDQIKVEDLEVTITRPEYLVDSAGNSM